MSDPLIIAGREFGSRLFLGTAGYPNRKLMLDSIAASGYGFMSSPLASLFNGSSANGDVVYGLVSNGIFVGSSTENGIGYNDLMIAAPLPSPTIYGFSPAMNHPLPPPEP